MNVVITAEGIVSAIGNGETEVLESLRSQKSGIGAMCYLNSIHKELPVGEVKMSNREMMSALGISQDEEMSRTSLLAITAIQQIVSTLPSRKQGEDSPRILLLSGTSVGTMDMTEQHFHAFAIERATYHPKYHGCGGSTQCVADYFGIFDDQTTVSTACSSAANAIVLGANLIKAGQADIVVAGGTEALSQFHLNGFNSLMILDHERCRPFDATRAGLNLGEGAAFVVLESEEFAQKRGAEIHAYLAGYGNACDAFHQTASSDNGEGAFLAMTEALAMGGLQPADIQYVNAHGTGTQNNDQSEGVALWRVFGDKMPWVSSTKSFTGHTTSASGSIETVISILALRHHFVPANLGWKQQMPDGVTPSLGEDEAAIQNILCNSFGFGGNDTSLLLSANRPCVKQTMSEAHENVENPFRSSKVKVLSRVEISSKEELKAIRDFVKPIEARRMGVLLKGSLLSSLKALREAEIEMPDAIITGTANGCLVNSEQLLKQMLESGEEMVSPTYFMQSTHNTIGSNIAVKTHCHGYNTTYSQGTDSLRWAMMDAELLLRSGKCKTVLVGCHEEVTEKFSAFFGENAYADMPEGFHSVAMVLTLEETNQK